MNIQIDIKNDDELREAILNIIRGILHEKLDDVVRVELSKMMEKSENNISEKLIDDLISRYYHRSNFWNDVKEGIASKMSQNKEFKEEVKRHVSNNLSQRLFRKAAK